MRFNFFEDSLSSPLTVWSFLICLVFAIVSGFILSKSYSFKNEATKSFLVTLATLPPIVTVIILMVNGNIGTGVAVAGVFSLVRFRSIPGTAKEIGAIFIAMGAGLIFGLGYIGYGIIFTIILSAVTLIYNFSSFGDPKISTNKRLTITIPEDLNYTEIFKDIMEKYTEKCEMISVKTTNMGSLFKISYKIALKNLELEKEFIDEIRVRNGNLEISISSILHNSNEL